MYCVVTKDICERRCDDYDACELKIPHASQAALDAIARAKEAGTATTIFDKAIASTINNERGAVYGHPLDNFTITMKLQDAIIDCPDTEILCALNMILAKVARLVKTPDHLDSVIDIAGYARTIAMILDERKVRNAKSLS